MLNILGRHNIISSLIAAFLFLTLAVRTSAQQLIHHPAAGEGQEVLYWHTFEVSSLPTSAKMTLSTQGFCIAYINGRLVLPSSLWPFRSEELKGVATISVNVTDFLHTGKNVVAICNAPFLHADGVGMIIHGRYGDGREEVLIQTDLSWICRPAPGIVTQSGESVDGIEYYRHWERYHEVENDCKWIGVDYADRSPEGWTAIGDFSMKPAEIVKPSFSERTDTTLTFHFSSMVEGQLRLTLRGTTNGHILDVNGMKYRCIGMTDEQLITRFASIKADSIVISNITKKFNLPNVQSVEVIKQKRLWMR